MTWTPSDERWMRRALELAQKGQLTTWPNPMVGCVVVSDNQILGEGWHRRFGEGHAEVNALSQVDEGADLSKATAYVTLEPCSHHGKTPPCADLLTSRGVGRVIVAAKDPNPMVAGRGLATLTKAGIEVIAGCLEDEAKELNRKFFFAMNEGRPWVTLKWAQSRDGFVDPDERATDGRGGHPLTGDASARHTHTLRATHDGILVGMRTWLVDRPALSTRHVPGRSPQKFILTSGNAPKPDNAPAAEAKTTLVVPHAQRQAPVLNTWREAGYEVLGVRGLTFSSSWWTDFRAQTGIHACMVEGGAQVAASVLSSDVWDEVHVLTAPAELGSGLKAPAWPGGQPEVATALGEDMLNVWDMHQNPSPC
jgi:diaminohydroxyphosphoribosylaminopyrimidine deaminase/5-amino-6-(5-phosphoribosylamino)uracil reductase